MEKGNKYVLVHNLWGWTEVKKTHGNIGRSGPSSIKLGILCIFKDTSIFVFSEVVVCFNPRLKHITMVSLHYTSHNPRSWGLYDHHGPLNQILGWSFKESISLRQPPSPTPPRFSGHSFPRTCAAVGRSDTSLVNLGVPPTVEVAQGIY